MLTPDTKFVAAFAIALPKNHVIRSVLMLGVAASLLASTTDANASRKSPQKEAKKEQQQAPPKGPLMIDVSIANQRLTLFDGDVAIAHAPVSTGMSGHPTPLGVFSVIQKQKWHESNIYSGAPMPFMERITWSGVAMHAGVLPGYPASHGCIRMPHEFAVRLYGMTKIGARVFVTHNEISPLPFANPHLFVPKPPEPPVASASPSESTPPADPKINPSGEPIVGAKSTEPANALPIVDSGVSTNTSSDAVATKPTPVSDPRPTQASSAPLSIKDGALDPSRTDPPAQNSQTTSGEHAPASEKVQEIQPSQAGEPRSRDPDISGSVIVQPKQRESQNADAEVAEQIKPDGAPVASDVNANVVQEAAPNADQPATDVPIPQVRPQLPQLKPGPISIFISRKLSRLFVRKAFAPVFDAAVTITDPERPLGTYVFTATDFSDDHSAMRWLLVAMPSEPARKEERRGSAAEKSSRKKQTERVVQQEPRPSAADAAAAALERIDVPNETRDQIAELLGPGSSLIITDKDLGPETGTADDTDFVVLTR